MADPIRRLTITYRPIRASAYRVDDEQWLPQPSLTAAGRECWPPRTGLVQPLVHSRNAAG